MFGNRLGRTLSHESYRHLMNVRVSDFEVIDKAQIHETITKHASQIGDIYVARNLLMRSYELLAVIALMTSFYY